ncbi:MULTISPECIES: hypothetical protein [Muribaculaceae]|uniref:Uncharacterized protein n=1 Tax=Lepagella muris TaxID=3032870 RepID=A0AC61RJR2_9BACT|nr:MULTISPECIES: hypothetical protein [Muribaculaceae]TGY80252.1 hypothetical protein E5331_03170 [Lepagella muris]THG52791.1 hypothetical protein E5984_05650 [Bacteroidales bacterium]TKC54141.1 hypothetical protein E5359_019780 [Bacteroidales bacterium]
MKTATAYIINTPLSVSLYMDIIGGGLEQTKNADGLFDPDRTLFPLALRPRLAVKDPDHVLADGDHTTGLIDTRWYIGTDDKGTRITESTSGFSLGAYGELTVRRNVEPSSPLSLYFTCGYIDPRTQKTIRKSQQVTLTTVQNVELNLSLEIDAAQKMAISPFKNQALRTITATFRNGSDPVPDARAVYSWQVLERSALTWRAIGADDPFYVSGQGTKALVIDRRYIDREAIRLEAHHKSAPSRVVSAMTKAYRCYGQWDEREMLTRGKFVRHDTREIEARAVIDTPRGQVTRPEDYFDITHIFTTNEKGAPEKVIGYGEKAVVGAGIAGRDPNVLAVFGCEVRERTALRVCTIGGRAVQVNGKVMCISIPKP